MPSVYEVETADGKVYEVALPTESGAPSKTLSDLSPLQQAFAPANLIRERVGQQVQGGMQAGMDVAGAGPVGQAASLMTNPILKYLASRVPQMTGQAVGTAASLPFDPATYAFGGIGAIPSRTARTALGAVTGGVAAAGQPNPTLPGVALGTVAGGVGSALTRTSKQGVRFAETRRQRLQQADQAVTSADQTLTAKAEDQVLRMRQGGDLHDRVMQTLRNESEKAWAPMKQVTSSIPGTIGIDEVRQQLSTQLAEKPERLQAAMMFLDDMATSKEYKLPKSGRGFAFTAADWSDLSSELGTFIRRGAHKGKAAFTLSDIIKNDLRTAVGNLIETKAPDQFKGFVQQANMNWAGYATDRDELFRLFQVGSHPYVSPKTGTNFLRRAAEGTLDPFEQRFLQRLQDKAGLDLPAALQPFATSFLKERLKQQLLQQSRPSLMRKALTYGVPAAIGAGMASAGKAISN